MPALGAEEDVFVTWAPWWLSVAAGAFPASVSAEMPGEKFFKEGWHIHRADRSVFGTAAIEAAIQLVELPGDVHRLAVDAVRGKADGFAPPHPGVRHGDHHDKVGVSARKHRAALREQKDFEGCRPRLLGLFRSFDPLLSLPALATLAGRRVQLDVPGNSVCEDRGERGPRLTSGTPSVATGNNLLLPEGDCFRLQLQRPEGSVSERGQDVNLYRVSVGAECVQLQVEGGEPLVDPFGECDSPGAGIDIGVVADCRLLVAAVILGIFARTEPRL